MAGIRAGNPVAGPAYAESLTVAALVLAGRKDRENNLTDPTLGSTRFIQDYGQPLPGRALRPVRIYGPFTNPPGGGDVPRGATVSGCTE